MDAYNKGWNDFDYKNQDRSINPYEKGTNYYYDWIEGWQQARMEWNEAEDNDNVQIKQNYRDNYK